MDFTIKLTAQDLATLQWIVDEQTAAHNKAIEALPEGADAPEHLSVEPPKNVTEAASKQIRSYLDGLNRDKKQTERETRIKAIRDEED